MPIKEKRLVGTLSAAVGLFLVSGFLWAKGYRVNITQSLPQGLYKVVEQPAKRFSVVLGCLPPAAAPAALRRGYVGKGSCPSGTRPLGKYLAGLPGDTVRVTRLGVWINGQKLPRSRPLRRDSAGKRLTPAYGSYVLGAGTYFLFSNQHPRSYDSRYFGPVRHLQAVVEPVWTF